MKILSDSDNNGNIIDMSVNHKCSRCGNCCGLFIPFTEKELSDLKGYVKKHNIQPATNRLNKMTGEFKAHCCFYDETKKMCTVYEVRPFACRDFKCDRKNWKAKRDIYEKRAKYNSTLSKKLVMGTFDDLIYKDYYPIIRYLFSLLPRETGGIESAYVLELLKQVNRLDLLNYIIAEDTNGNKIEGTDLT
jgi:Fe-S-cluster containining protein